MDSFTQVIGTPVSVLTLLAALLLVLERLISGGWLNLKIGKDKDVKKITNEILGSKMDVLSAHFNHETTDSLYGIELGLKEMRGTQLEQSVTLENINDAMQDLVRNGVRIRK